MRAPLLLLTALAAGVMAAASEAPTDFAAARRRMVAEQLEARGIADPRVLAAMGTVPREAFVPSEQRGRAYADEAVPIGHDQTISQPYVVAAMSELARVVPGARALEVGTGSGYQAAVLAEMGAEVYSIEIVEPLARGAERTLARLGYGRVHVRHGDGYRGWPSAAPFAAILVTAAAPRVPPALLEQLAPGGRLVIPVDVEGGYQELRVYVRSEQGVTVDHAFDVQFVPMTGEIRRRPPEPGGGQHPK